MRTRRCYDMNDFYIKLGELSVSGDCGAVEKFILSAIEASGENTPERAGLYTELAGFYREQERYPESEEALSKALEMFKDEGMDAVPEYTVSLMGLAELYRLKGEAGDHCGALDGFSRALEDMRQYFGENEEFAMCKVNISEAYELLGDFRRALAELSGAADILERLHGRDHDIVKSTQAKLKNMAKKAETVEAAETKE